MKSDGNRMLLAALLLVALHSTAQGEVVAVTEESPAMPSQLGQDQQKASSSQVEMVKLLKVLRDQGTQQLANLHSLASHQRLLVENNQAVLLQISRIASLLQDLLKNLQPPGANGKLESGVE